MGRQIPHHGIRKGKRTRFGSAADSRLDAKSTGSRRPLQLRYEDRKAGGGFGEQSARKRTARQKWLRFYRENLARWRRDRSRVSDGGAAGGCRFPRSAESGPNCDRTRTDRLLRRMAGGRGGPGVGDF